MIVMEIVPFIGRIPMAIFYAIGNCAKCIKEI